jgi:hypothetical protein
LAIFSPLDGQAISVMERGTPFDTFGQDVAQGTASIRYTTQEAAFHNRLIFTWQCQSLTRHPTPLPIEAEANDLPFQAEGDRLNVIFLRYKTTDLTCSASDR